MISEQGALHFHFVQGLAAYIAGSGEMRPLRLEETPSVGMQPRGRRGTHPGTRPAALSRHVPPRTLAKVCRHFGCCGCRSPPRRARDCCLREPAAPEAEDPGQAPPCELVTADTPTLSRRVSQQEARLKFFQSLAKNVSLQPNMCSLPSLRQGTACETRKTSILQRNASDWVAHSKAATSFCFSCSVFTRCEEAQRHVLEMVGKKGCSAPTTRRWASFTPTLGPWVEQQPP